MEGASFLSSRSIGYRPAPNDSVAALASNNNQKSLTPILDRFKVLLKQREEEIRVSNGGDDDIESPVLSTEEIVELYEDVLSELIINSKPIITDLTIIAGEQREHGAGIADAICARIIEVPVEQKLPSLYLLDSIVKNIGREYVRHFSARLPEVYCAAYSQVHPSLHPSMRHLFGTWSTVFPSSVLRKIETLLQFSPSSSYQSSGLKEAESPRPAHGIHVNPKYLEARRQLESSTADSKNQHARAISAPKILGQPSTGFDEYESDNGDPLSSHIGPQSLSSNSHVGRTPFGLSHTKPPSPALEEFSIVDSPRRVVEGSSPSYHGYGYRPGGVTGGDDEPPRDWRRSHLSGGSRPLEGSSTHSVSNGFDIQRPRDLINAYGTDERNKTANQKLQNNVKKLTVNGLGSKVSGQPTWQNAEEEEFEWEDMSPTLADRSRGSDLFSQTGSLKTGHARGANRFPPTKTDFGRGDWSNSNQELIPSAAPNNTVSLSDRGLKRKIGGFQNETSDIPIPHYPQESSSLSHDQPWGGQHHYNLHGRRPPPIIDSFPGGNPQHHLSSIPRLNSSNLGMMNLEASIPTSKGSWRPQINIQKSQPLPVQPSLPFQKHGRSPFDTLNASNSAVNDNSSFLNQPQFDNTRENRPSSQLPQLPNQQSGFASHQQNTRFSPQEIRNMVSPTLGFNPSHLGSRPMIRGYAPTQRFDGTGGGSLNPVPGMQSSMPFHLHGVGVPPLPPGPPPIPQLPLALGPTPPGGGALSGLFSSLVAQGLLSLTKTPEQDSVGLEFDPDVLKTRHESAIIALYADLPRQCKTCGRRFKLQEEHSSHMDWHVTKNRVSKTRKQKPSQKWFANVSLWLSSAESLGTDPVPGFLNQSENVVEKKDDEEMAVPADEDQNVCALCGEPFDDFYSDETEEWMYRGAVYMNAPSELTVGMDRSRLGPIVHAKCRSESTVAPPDDSGNNERVFNEERMRS